MKTTLSALAMATLAGAFWLGASALPDTGAARAQAAGTAAPAAAEDPARDIIMGNVDAPVTIIEYASFTCPHCAAFSNDVFPEIKKEYIDTGKVRFVLREFPLDPLATAGFMLARCNGNDKYTPMTDLLFAQQKNWAFTDKPVDALASLSKQAGYSQQSFEACLKRQDIYDAINQVKDRGFKIVSVGLTVNFPLGIYSAKYKSWAEVPDGATIAIQNDPTNGGRSLLLLQDKGVIKLKDGVGFKPTVADIVSNPKKLKIVEVEAAQTARSLQDVAAAAINTNYAVDAKIEPTSAILREDPKGPYVNLIAVRAADEDLAEVTCATPETLASLARGDEVCITSLSG